MGKGFDAMKEKAEKLKIEKATHDESETKAAMTALEKIRQTIAANPEMKARMEADAREESEKSGGPLPFLKVYVANKSTQTLADGTDPTNGWFFYTPTREQYEVVHCHILSISRGFRMPGMADEKGVVKNRWNHIVSGIILNDEPKPFWLFVSGQARVARLWEFQKTLKVWNREGIPSFPLVIKLTTEKVKTEKSPAMVINFAVEQDEEGNPMMVTEQKEYMELREKVSDQESYIEAYINRKEVVEEARPVQLAQPVQEKTEELPPSKEPDF